MYLGSIQDMYQSIKILRTKLDFVVCKITYPLLDQKKIKKHSKYLTRHKNI